MKEANCRHLISTPQKVFIKHKKHKSCLFEIDNSHLLEKTLHCQRAPGRCYVEVDPLCNQTQNNVHLGLGEYRCKFSIKSDITYSTLVILDHFSIRICCSNFRKCYTVHENLTHLSLEIIQCSDT
jgi:hypothetical protein